jgi:glycosyltransferase involved in cell wall biosynthesis
VVSRRTDVVLKPAAVPIPILEAQMPAMTGAAPGVSFVMTVYNKREYLPAVVAGLAAQRGDFPREFIFVDDGSTDGSLEEIARLTSGWSDARIFSQSNSGPSRATNRGIAAARYPLIKLVDSDDVLLPHATAMLRDALLRDPAAVLAWGGVERYTDPTDAMARLQCKAPVSTDTIEFDALPALLRNCELTPSQSIVRAEFVRRLGGSDERVFVQDYSMFLRLATSGPFVRLAAPVSLMPAAPGHLGDSQQQALHDINLALFYFLSEHRVPRRLAAAAARRGLKRAWRWAHRRERVPVLDRSFLRMLKGYLSFPRIPLALLQQSCEEFAASRPVRRL